MNDTPILDGLDEGIVRELNEPDRSWSTLSKMAALGSVPVALAGAARDAFGQSLPQGIVDVLNFALTLEYLESEFYNLGQSAEGLIPTDLRDVFDQIRIHENAHVALLESVLGARAVDRPEFDFTAGGMFPDVFSDFQTFATLAQAFEDTGVRAYKGQAPNLMSHDMILRTALRIHSVEARHASEVRRIRGLQGWIPQDGDDVTVAAIEPVYQGDGQVVQLGVDVRDVTRVSFEAITEAFDEPLTRSQVLGIAEPFIVG